MFTGIITHLGEIVEIVNKANSARLTIRSKLGKLVIGESIAIDGICLTVVQSRNDLFDVDVSPETLSLTTVHHWQQGQLIHLERALRLQDRAGGHFVLGHVDTIAKVSELSKTADYLNVVITGIARDQEPLITPKGCIAINGVSLTVNTVHDSGFSMMLIPHSLQATNLHSLQIGQNINIEFDTINRAVWRQLHYMRKSDEYS